MNRVPARRLLEQGYQLAAPDLSAPPTLNPAAKNAATDAIQTDLAAYLMATLDPKLLGARARAALGAALKKNPQMASPEIAGLDWVSISKDTVNSAPVKGAMAALNATISKAMLAAADKLMIKNKPQYTPPPPNAGAPAPGAPGTPIGAAPPSGAALAAGPPSGTAP